MILRSELRTQIIVSLVSVLIALLVCAAIARNYMREYREVTESSLVAYREQFLLRAEEADRNQSIEESRSIIFDCGNRARFEELLSRLNSLTQSERNELDVLFPACGDYPVRLKFYLAESLDRIRSEYAVHKKYSNIFFNESEKDKRILGLMDTVTTLEFERALLMRTQVLIQADINAALNKEKDEAGKTIAELAQNGQSLGGTFITINASIDEARAELNQLVNE